MKNVLILLLVASVFVRCASPETKEATTAPAPEPTEQAEEVLQLVAEFDTRPGNVAVSKDGRVFTTMHPMDPSAIQLVEVTGRNSMEPFPSAEYQKNGEEASDNKLDTPLGIRIDKNNVLWITDMGRNLGKSRIFGFDIATKKEVFRFDIPEDIAPKGSFVQDLAVDEENGWIYLADIADPGILIVNTEQKTVRRFGDDRLKSEDVDMVIDGEVIEFGGSPARVAINPITLSSDKNTLFFGAMNGTKWYSVPTSLLREGKQDEEIANAIKIAGEKPLSDGAITAADGNHYFTNLEEYGIDVLSPSGELKPLVRDQTLDWPDNVSISNGWLYILVNQLHKAPAFTGGEDLGEPPYFITKMKLKNDL